MSKTITNLSDLIDMSIDKGPFGIEIDCEFTIAESIDDTHDQYFKAYTATLDHRDILLYTDKGTLSYVVDTYGDRSTATLFDWDLD